MGTPATAQGRARHAAFTKALPLVLAVAGLAWWSRAFPELDHNFDEGVYIYQARAVAEGAVPLVDFFHHQPPLYLYLLAPFGALSPEETWPYRFLSVLALAATSLALWLLARRLGLGRWPAAFAVLAINAVPLADYARLALPNALAVAGALWSLLLLVSGQRRVAPWLGGALGALALACKPLVLPTIVLTGLWGLHTDRRRLAAWVAGGLICGVGLWGWWHLATDGAFTELLWLQASRFEGRHGFEVMSRYAPFRAIAAQRGVGDALGWNWSEHVWAFWENEAYQMGRSSLWPGPRRWNANLILVLLATTGAVLALWRRRPERRAIPWLLGWTFLVLGFDLWIWEPVWEHYFVQYLPILALLAASTIGVLLEEGKPLGNRPLAAAALAAIAVWLFAAGSLHLRHPRWLRSPHLEKLRVHLDHRPLLTFDPYMNAQLQAPPACGLVDPFNVYGEASLVGRLGSSRFRRFLVLPSELAACLAADNRWLAARTPWLEWFRTSELDAVLRALPRRRWLHWTRISP